MRRLLIRPGAIGDCITCLPVMERLRSDYTEVWIPSAIVPLIDFANRVRPLPETGIDLLGVTADPPRRMLESLASFDGIVSWYGTNRPEFRESAMQVNPNWQFFPALPPQGSSEHATDFFARVAGLPPGMNPSIRTNEPKPREAVVIQPFSGSKLKNWPLERFKELATRLPLPTEWLCGPEEELHGAHRFEDLKSLAQWIRGARLYVGNDSGISHLAAATGVPTIALFGASDPAIWAPRGACVKVIQASSMQAIQVEVVLEAANLLLASKQLSASTAESVFVQP
jgi:lipopolysaccharide heptosyltransferase III